MIIGVTGNNGSGKDTFAQYLIDNFGFIHISLSDFIREETIRRGEEMTRYNFHNIANQMRSVFGPGILAQLALEKIDANKDCDYVITSIRNPVEIKKLNESGKFFLVAIDAPIKSRFDRIIERNRKDEKEILSFDEFEKFEIEESQSDSQSGQQIRECIKMANFVVPNDKDLPAFFEAAEDVFNKIKTLAGI